MHVAHGLVQERHLLPSEIKGAGQLLTQLLLCKSIGELQEVHVVTDVKQVLQIESQESHFFSP